MAIVEAHQLRKIQGGEHVPVHCQKRLVEAFDARQGAGRSEGFILPPIAQLEVIGEIDVVEIGLDQPAEVPDR